MNTSTNAAGTKPIGIKPGHRSGTSYPEQYVYWAIKQIYPDAVNRFKTSNNVEYDIYIPSIRLAIEVNGYLWHKDKEVRDYYKRVLAEENNVRLIQVTVYDKNDAFILPFAVSYNHNEYGCNLYEGYAKSLDRVINSILRDYGHHAGEINWYQVKCNACDYSFNHKLEYNKSLQYLMPGLAAEWHPTRNGNLKPKDVTPGSRAIVWWKCPDCEYEWEASIHERVYNRRKGYKNCKKCAALQRRKPPKPQKLYWVSACGMESGYYMLDEM